MAAARVADVGGEVGREKKDACNKDPFLFVSADAGGRKILIG